MATCMITRYSKMIRQAAWPCTNHPPRQPYPCQTSIPCQTNAGPMWIKATPHQPGHPPCLAEKKNNSVTRQKSINGIGLRIEKICFKGCGIHVSVWTLCAITLRLDRWMWCLLSAWNHGPCCICTGTMMAVLQPQVLKAFWFDCCAPRIRSCNGNPNRKQPTQGFCDIGLC